MSIFAKLRVLARRITKTISNIVRTTTLITGNLIGLRKEYDKWDIKQLSISGWIFIMGIPTGYILMGSLFSIPIWGATVLLILMLCNLDHTINMLLKVEKEKCLHTFSYI